MSRSNYSEDGDNWACIRWSGAVKSAMRGQRGQSFLKELLAAMDAMENKELIADELEFNGQFCALGVVGNKRGIDMSEIDPEDEREVSKAFGIARAMAHEIAYMNDEGVWWCEESPRHRWARMREWVEEQINE